MVEIPTWLVVILVVATILNSITSVIISTKDIVSGLLFGLTGFFVIITFVLIHALTAR